MVEGRDDSGSRLLLRSALILFAITIIIGILNGMDVWEPSHNLLLTHVHAGTLGWITLAVVAAAIHMFPDGGSTRSMAMMAVIGAVAYVIAFASTSGIMRPVTGTLMLIAIVWVLVWAWRSYAASARSTAQLGTLLALVSLTIGAVLGILLGIFAARGEIPGLSTDTASSLAGAHPPAMLIGYLILAGAAVTHWLLDGTESRAGRSVMWALFLAGIAANLAFILGIDPLIQVATLLEVVAIVTFVVHMWPRIRAWAGGAADDFARVSVYFLAAGIALLVYVVQLVVSGELDPEAQTGPIHVLLAFDHIMFIGVMTNALFALVSRTSAAGPQRLIMAGVNVGLVVFLMGLLLDTAVLKRIGAPVMGLFLLHALSVFFIKLSRDAEEPRREPGLSSTQ